MYATAVKSVRSPHHKKSRSTVVDARPVVQVLLNSTTQTGPKVRSIFALLDSGASSSIVQKSLINEEDVEQTTKTVWSTANGKFTTGETVKLAFTLPEINEQRVVHFKVHIADDILTSYDMIIRCDILTCLGLQLDFDSRIVRWDDAYCPMRHSDSLTTEQKNQIFINESDTAIGSATSRVKNILDAKYSKANLAEVASSNPILSKTQQRQLQRLLEQFEDLFDGTLGHWSDHPYEI